MAARNETLIPKLDSLARCIMRIESKMPFTLDQLKGDADLQDVISPKTATLLQKAVGFRNILSASQ